MRIQVEVPDAVFAKLATMAEQRDVRIAELIAAPLAEAIKDTLHPGRRKPDGVRAWVRMTPEREAQLVNLHRLGYSWAEISARIGVSTASVMNHARRLGLKSARQRVHERNAAQSVEEGTAA